jgi:flagellar protein FliS
MAAAGNDPRSTNVAILRSRYVKDAVDTTAPGRLIVALYDRLLLDLERASDGVARGDIELTHECLVHAQLIVAELYSALDTDAWPPAQGLADIYLFVHRELITANVEKRAERIDSCRSLLTPLRDAWYAAAGIVPSKPVGGAR